MFWGKGDTAKLKAPEKTTLDNLERLVETGHIIALDPGQTESAVLAVEFFGQIRSVLKLAGSLKNIGLFVGLILSAYWATGGAVLSWIATLGP